MCIRVRELRVNFRNKNFIIKTCAKHFYPYFLMFVPKILT